MAAANHKLEITGRSNRESGTKQEMAAARVAFSYAFVPIDAHGSSGLGP
ncbi:unnamed protein product [Rhodiola kirilowii]